MDQKDQQIPSPNVVLNISSSSSGHEATPLNNMFRADEYIRLVKIKR
jgi:hypothetical protein